MGGVGGALELLTSHLAGAVWEARLEEVRLGANLVIVVDEFATLVREVPQFVDGMVDLAQRGRRCRNQSEKRQPRKQARSPWSGAAKTHSPG